MYYAVYNGIWLTTQALSNTPVWYKINNILIGGAYCMEGTSDGNILYVGTENGQLYRISGLNINYPSNYTGNFTALPIAAGITCTKIYQEPNYKTISGIGINPTSNDSIVFTKLAFGDSVCVQRINNAASTVGITTPENISFNLPKIPCYDIAIHPADGKRTVLATEKGVYSAVNVWDSSISWSSENTSFPNIVTTELQFLLDTFGLYKNPTHAQTDYFLFATTWGRGVFYTPDFCTFFDTLNTNKSFPSAINTVNTDLNFNIFPNPSNDIININIQTNSNKNCLEIYNINGSKIYEKNNINAGLQSINIADLSSGMYMLKLISEKQISIKKFVKY